jgi:hypothetical protein
VLAMPTYTGVRVNAASKDHPQLVIITIDLYGLLPPRLLPVQYVDLCRSTCRYIHEKPSEMPCLRLRLYFNTILTLF